MKHKKKSKQIRFHASNNKNYIGYCHSSRHKGYITKEILKEHQCINQKYIDENGHEAYRVCPRLEKFENKDFWQRKERAKTLRNQQKKRTEMMERLYNEAKEHNISITELNKAAERYAYNENLIRVMLGLQTKKVST